MRLSRGIEDIRRSCGNFITSQPTPKPTIFQVIVLQKQCQFQVLWEAGSEILPDTSLFDHHISVSLSANGFSLIKCQ